MHYIKKAILNEYNIYKKHKTQNNHDNSFYVPISDWQVGIYTWISNSVLKTKFRYPQPIDLISCVLYRPTYFIAILPTTKIGRNPFLIFGSIHSHKIQ